MPSMEYGGLGRSPTVLVQRLTLTKVHGVHYGCIQTQKHGECGGTGARQEEKKGSMLPLKGTSRIHLN